MIKILKNLNFRLHDAYIKCIKIKLNMGRRAVERIFFLIILSFLIGGILILAFSGLDHRSKLNKNLKNNTCKVLKSEFKNKMYCCDSKYDYPLCEICHRKYTKVNIFYGFKINNTESGIWINILTSKKSISEEYAQKIINKHKPNKCYYNVHDMSMSIIFSKYNETLLIKLILSLSLVVTAIAMTIFWITYESLLKSRSKFGYVKINDADTITYEL